MGKCIEHFPYRLKKEENNMISFLFKLLLLVIALLIAYLVGYCKAKLGGIMNEG